MIQDIVLRLVADGDSFAPPSINEFLPPAFLFGGTPFAMNRLEIVRFAVVAFILLFFGVTLSRAKKRADSGNLVPTKPQSAIEWIFDFVKQFVYETLGTKAGKKWYPMCITIFCTILFMNLTGVVPTLNMAATAGFGVPLLLAVWVFIAYWREAITDHGRGIRGFFGFLKAEMFPPGLPFYVYPINAIIELAQVLIIRPASLAIRLFANMISGHILIALCFGATQFFVFTAEPAMKVIGVGTFVGAIFFFCFELLVACLQAYIFTLFLCVYISLSFNHDEQHA
ncbi:ATP synthase subunit a [Actinomycetota bacterium]|nr:ATP synthase subunit a [Actinomycetota bacterium]